MRIRIGSYWLAGDPTKSEREHSSALITYAPQRLQQGDRLWFWNPKGKYMLGIRWSKARGRGVLSHAIWERAHGKPVPAHHVVRYKDGNENNLDPSNLHLATRNDLARENQSAHYRRKSRAIVSLLLERTQAKPDPHESPDTLTKIHRRAAR